MEFIKRNWTWGVAAAIGLVLIWVLLGGSAKAADLGGNCCADLEERIAELEATAARKGNRKVSLVVTGQINKAIYWYDAKDFGLGSNTHVIENGASESRVAITGAAQIRPGWFAGYTLEIGQGRTGLDVDLLSGVNVASDNDLYTRQSYAFIKSDDLGTLSIGLQSMATDDLSHQNVANTDAATKRLTAQPLGGVTLSFGNIFSTPFIEIEPFNGRKANSVRYTSPAIAGFQASAAWASDDDAWDVALRYAGAFAGFNVVAAAGYYDDKTNDIVEQIAGPVSGVGSKTLTLNAGAKHVGTGLFVQGTWARLEIDGLAPTTIKTDAYHVQAGIERKWFEMGETTLFGEYADWDDLGLSFYGVGLNQRFSDAIDLYALARRYDVDGGGEMDTILGGVRVRF